MAKTLNNDVFDSIHHSIDTLHSLQNCRDVFVMDREDVDKRFFEEISKCEALIKQFESIFLENVMEDSRAISNAAVINTDNSSRAEELIERINNLIGDFNRMETEHIARSETLRGIANQFRSQLAAIRKNMEARIMLQQKHKKALDSAVIGLKNAN
ncbi:hypothetical protein HYX03_00565 [Candidatus Woesearchaeota archaeon]|nr:hypothetical protein [Candidatus Woesearchaeota archaeon]